MNQLSSKVTITINTDKVTGLTHLHTKQKYYERAEFVLYRINIWNPCTPPVFIINISDLTKQLQYELEQLKLLSSEQFDRVVTEVLQSIMEGVNQRYYHISNIAYKISWRFDP